jgi:hypothetical protein
LDENTKIIVEIHFWRIAVNERLTALRKTRDELQKNLDIINTEIIRLKNECEYDDTKICEFIKNNTSYVCKLCKRIILHR